MGANGTQDFSNDTLPGADGEPDHNFAALVFGIFLILFIISGNLLVCLSVCTEKALKTTTNYFIVSLAVADLLLAILVLPLYVYSEIFCIIASEKKPEKADITVYGKEESCANVDYLGVQTCASRADAIITPICSTEG
ncbi:hypothetical protein lerEdw1_005194 [Lerista edwardsae]|nr:hypothetical protein lerEdw1_005194 [Lerista edwardsae]